MKATEPQITEKRTTFRDVLIHEFEARMRRSASYSLRAYARDLGIASSGLSRILGGQQGLSVAKAKEFSKRLDFSQVEAEHFCSLVQAESSRSQTQRELALQKLQSQQGQILELSLDYFKAIAEWQYFALLALTEVSDFESSPEWIARRLGLTIDQARETIARLLKLDLLEVVDGKLKKVDALVTTPTGIPSRSLKSHHQQILKKAEAALFEQDVSERDFSTLSFAMDPDDISWAREEMQKFRRELTERLRRRKVKTRLYHLSMQLFALDTLKPKPKKETKEAK